MEKEKTNLQEANFSPVDASTSNATGCILVTRFEALSDVITTIPVLYDACMANPGLTVVMLTRRSMTGLFINAPANLVVHGEPYDKFKNPFSILDIVKNLHSQYGFDRFVDLQGVFKTLVARTWCRVKGIRVSVIDHGHREKSRLTRKHGKLMLPVKHTIDRYRDAVKNAGVYMIHSFSGLFTETPPSPAMYAKITSPKKQGEVWIGIAPFAKYTGKIYPLNLMEQVLRELSGRSHVTVFLYGGGRYEHKILSEWARKYPSTISLAGERHGFGVELALLHDLDLLISMDSANMHMGSLVGTPVVTLWGATHPYCGYSGWNIPESNNVHLPMPCRPCALYGNKPCLSGDYRCLANIKPEVVTHRVDELLSKL